MPRVFIVAVRDSRGDRPTTPRTQVPSLAPARTVFFSPPSRIIHTTSITACAVAVTVHAQSCIFSCSSSALPRFQVSRPPRTWQFYVDLVFRPSVYCVTFCSACELHVHLMCVNPTFFQNRWRSERSHWITSLTHSAFMLL